MCDFTIITPLWNRPKLLPSFIRMIQNMDYPREQFCHLLLDDSGQFTTQEGTGWQLIAFKRPFHSLPEKFNALLGMVTTRFVMVGEDDDLYLSPALKAHAAALEKGDVSKPSKVLTQCGGREQVEDACGRFHASIAFRADVARKLGGWVITDRADFDLQFLARLRDGANVVDPLSLGFSPFYVFRWETSLHSHAQGVGHGPDDEGWLERARAAAGPIEFVGKLFP